MPGPLADVIYIHRPIRRDLLEMKTALSSGGTGSLGQIADRFAFLRRMLRIHESGEEEILFPAIDALVPGASDPYTATHTSNRAIMDRLDVAFADGDAAVASRLMSELESIMSAHLDQEEGELVPLCEQHLAMADQGALVGRMSAHGPAEDQAPMTGWMVRLLSPEDRAGFVSMVMGVMPPEAFAGMKMGLKAALPGEDWSDLAARVPELEG